MEFRTIHSQDTTGRPIASGTAYVYTAGTTTQATIYDEDLAVLTQPLTTGQDGNIGFRARNGEYDVSVSKNGQTVTAQNLRFYDPADEKYSTRAALITAIADGYTWPDGAIVSDGTVKYKAVSGSTAIADLPGLVPYGKAYPDHWAANTTPGTTDMTTAFTRAVAYTKELYLFDTSYRVTSEIRIYGRNGFKLTGVSKYTTKILADTGSYSVLTFYTGELSGSTPLSNRGVELRNFQIDTPGSTERTGGYLIEFEERGEDCVFDNLLLNNGYHLIRAAAMARTFFSRLDLQGSRRTTTGGYMIEFTSDENAGIYTNDDADACAKCTDVHLTDCQFNAGGSLEDPYTASVFIGAADGIYFNNCHIRGSEYAVRAQTAQSPCRMVISSCSFVNCYFDNVTIAHVAFFGYGNGETFTQSGAGSASTFKFRDFVFTGCRFRRAQGTNASCFASLTAGDFHRPQWIGGTIRDNVYSGIRAATDGQGFKYARIDNVIFSGNNTENNASHGDVYLYNADHMITDNTLLDGGDLGYGIRTITSASGGPSVIRGNDVRNSTAANPISGGTTSIVYGNPGYIQTNSGTATVLSGNTSVTVTHGLAVTPAVDDIQLSTLDATVSGVTRFGVQAGSISSTQFVIETNAAPAADFRVLWTVDAQKRQE